MPQFVHTTPYEKSQGRLEELPLRCFVDPRVMRSHLSREMAFVFIRSRTPRLQVQSLSGLAEACFSYKTVNHSSAFKTTLFCTVKLKKYIFRVKYEATTKYSHPLFTPLDIFCMQTVLRHVTTTNFTELNGILCGRT